MKIKFRASQMHKIMTGTIGLTENQQDELSRYLLRKERAITGEEKPLTATMLKKMDYLLEKKSNPELPKTMLKELHQIYRAIKYKRNFSFTNKYIQKGILQENEAITLFQTYLKKVEGVGTLFKKNEETLENEWFTGTPDIGEPKPIKKWGVGYDIKCSWSLDTFPFIKDDLDALYEYQNQVYMNLTGAKEWYTAFTLVNCTEHQLNVEKLKWFYAMDAPGEGDPFYEEMIEQQRNCEKMMVFDYDLFVERHPFHSMEIGRDEWYGEGYDIPLSERVILKKSVYDPNIVDQMIERVELSRKYINNL